MEERRRSEVGDGDGEDVMVKWMEDADLILEEEMDIGEVTIGEETRTRGRETEGEEVPGTKSHSMDEVEV